jgi:ferredoxin, 2Fe-2S
MHDLGIEGACEGSIACATCHVIVDAAYAGRLGEASAEEEDMLDLAVGVQPTSRLGCQIVLTDDLDGITVRLPGSV